MSDKIKRMTSDKVIDYLILKPEIYKFCYYQPLDYMHDSFKTAHEDALNGKEVAENFVIDSLNTVEVNTLGCIAVLCSEHYMTGNRPKIIMKAIRNAITRVDSLESFLDVMNLHQTLAILTEIANSHGYVDDKEMAYIKKKNRRAYKWVLEMQKSGEIENYATHRVEEGLNNFINTLENKGLYDPDDNIRFSVPKHYNELKSMGAEYQSYTNSICCMYGTPGEATTYFKLRYEKMLEQYKDSRHHKDITIISAKFLSELSKVIYDNNDIPIDDVISRIQAFNEQNEKLFSD